MDRSWPGAVAGAEPHPGGGRNCGSAHRALIRHHRGLHLARRFRILARTQRAFGVALARDLHAGRTGDARPAAHAARDAATVVASERGDRQYLAYGVELRGAAV